MLSLQRIVERFLVLARRRAPFANFWEVSPFRRSCICLIKSLFALIMLSWERLISSRRPISLSKYSCFGERFLYSGVPMGLYYVVAAMLFFVFLPSVEVLNGSIESMMSGLKSTGSC